jgi:hypothetical protein
MWRCSLGGLLMWIVHLFAAGVVLALFLAMIAERPPKSY